MLKYERTFTYKEIADFIEKCGTCDSDYLKDPLCNYCLFSGECQYFWTGDASKLDIDIFKED